jgi:hypothetical protein
MFSMRVTVVSSKLDGTSTFQLPPTITLGRPVQMFKLQHWGVHL